MELRCFVSVLRASLAALLAVAVPVLGGQPSRLRSEIQTNRTFALQGNVHPLVTRAIDQGEADDSQVLRHISIHFKLTAAQQADLNRLIEAQQDRSSPEYHQWLTPEQYAERFGLSTADLDRITAWLDHAGFTGMRAARSRTFVTMSGTAALARSAFRTAIHRYSLRGETHYGNATEPILPAELQGIVSGIRGLDDFRPRARTHLRPWFTSSISGNHFLAPGDFATIYGVQALYDRGIDGTGQSIAIAGQTDIRFSDLQAFQIASGLPIKNPLVILAGGDPGFSDGDMREACLDLEWSGAVARGANIIYVNSPDVFTSVTYAVDNNVAPILSVSYGTCETMYPSSAVEAMNDTLQQASAMGITVTVASGDFGPATCDEFDTPPVVRASQGLTVDYPASNPNVVAVGGTQFNDSGGTYWSTTNGPNSGSALSYIPETVWNEIYPDTNEFAASGGGASARFYKPSWQRGTGVPNDNARDVPDVSLNAAVLHVPYLMCDSGWCVNGYRDIDDYLDPGGGTSAGAPAFAGIVALINQAAGGRQGNINPTLYSLAASTPTAFHDITTGDNIVACEIGTADCGGGRFGYPATPGYDLATGLGSVNAYALVTSWPSVPPLPPAAPVLSSPANGATDVALAPNLTWQAATGATSYVVFFGTSSPPPQLAANVTATTYAPGSLTAGVTYYWSVTAVNSAGSSTSAIWSFTTQPSGGNPGALLFVPVTPCRVADTRLVTGDFGGPTMTGGTARSFAIPQSPCGIPSSAQAYSLNVTVVPHGALPYLTLWPTGQDQPFVSTLNSLDGSIVANAAIVPAGSNGAVSVFVANTADVVLDIDGYFGTAGGQAFYTVTPCRVSDTRNPTGPLGGPTMSAAESRNLPVLTSGCGIPASASAYSMNVTVVPNGMLAYLTMWPFGLTQPFVSTLNSLNGKILANAALVPAGDLGNVSVFVTNPTEVVLDTNGYFGAAGNAGALSFYPVTPCRVADTRNPDGPFGGPILGAASPRSFPVQASSCSIPSSARAYSLNVTVVPAGMLSYLTVWPAGADQPWVSTLNALDGSIVANAAIVPAGQGGAISVFATNPTHVILDINGYFAP